MYEFSLLESLKAEEAICQEFCDFYEDLGFSEECIEESKISGIKETIYMLLGIFSY